MILLWYLLVGIGCWVGLHSDIFVYTKKKNEVKSNRGILIVFMVASWLVIIAPAYTESNTMNLIDDVVLPNLTSVGSALLCLTASGIGISYTFHNSVEGNNIAAWSSFIVVVACFTSFVAIILVIIPLEVERCDCLYGYWGESCENSCYDPDNGAICAGHGTCNQDTGCICDGNFDNGLTATCDICINRYSYASNCTSCELGYSLTFLCTKCESGRDIEKDCTECLDSYWVDPDGVYNNPLTGTCTVCKPNYYKPSALPSRGSYNEFLQFGGDSCIECPKKDNLICGGHGQCQDFWQPYTAGEFRPDEIVINGISLLGLDASGDCICEVGYGGKACDVAPGYDLYNTESICNNNGFAFSVYEQLEDNIFETYKEYACDCNDGYSPSFTTSVDSCSCILDETGTFCEDCVYGYFLNSTGSASGGICQQCPGGNFLQGCNAGRGAGFCSSITGLCTCRISYDENGYGGYVGVDCKTCAPNFYRVRLSKFYIDATDKGDMDPEKCAVCPGATGETVQQACGGGYCITTERLNLWEADLNSENIDSYLAYSILVDTPKTITELRNFIGTCQCRSGFSVNPITGTCT